VIGIETLVATTFLKEFDSGSTRPCVFSCEDLSGNPKGEYVAKFRATVRGGNNGLCFEFLAAQISALLDIPSPKPAVIQFDTELAESIEDIAVKDRVERSLGLNFGTEYKTPGYTTWPKGDPIPPPLRQLAAEIVAFEVLIDNADRGAQKPNILYRNDEIFVIDHETAFAFTRLIGPPPDEWTTERIKFIYDHPFYPGLRGQALELDRFASNAERLTAEEIAAISAAVPDGFGRDHLEKIAAHFVSVGGQMHKMLEVIRRILQ
jgi:hypothetical protein